MPAKSWNDLRDLDDTGFAAKSSGFARDRRPERSHPAMPAKSHGDLRDTAPIGLVEAALAASACLLAWGLAIALIGIVAGTLTILGLV